jgi:hypothetical protein
MRRVFVWKRERRRGWLGEMAIRLDDRRRRRGINDQEKKGSGMKRLGR